MTKLNISPTVKGEPTVTVRTVCGEEFKAPAVGAVLASDYMSSTETIETLLETNRSRMADSSFFRPELLESAKETEMAYRRASRANKRYFKKLPRYYDYDRKGKLKNARS